jgi:undecaprenyl-diphosphatase
MTMLLVMIAGTCHAQEWFSWDGDLYRAIHDDMRCGLLDGAADVVGIASDAKTSMAVPLVLFTFGKEREIQTARLATIGIAASTVTVYCLKAVINRQRPSGTASRWDSSFPSGHTAVAFSTSVIYSSNYHKLWIPLMLFSAAVGLERIYSGDHYPTDVLAGMALGIGIGYGVVKLRKEILFFP